MFNNVFKRSVSKGDTAGHAFHGNQFVAGTGTRQENSQQHLDASAAHQAIAGKLQDKYAAGGDRKNMTQASSHEYAAKLHQAASDAALVSPVGYKEHGAVYAKARDKANAASASTSTTKGDSAGHEFHGNQWTAGSHSGSGGAKPDTKAIGKYLAEVGKSYHGSIPLTQMIDKMASHGYHAVQEDGSAWSGMLTGRDGRTTIDLRNASNGKIDNGLAIQWHKMDSGKWEVNSYLTGASASKSETEKPMKFLNIFANTLSSTATKADTTKKADLTAMRTARDKALAASDKANDMGQSAIAGSGSHEKAADAHIAAAKACSQAAQAANASGSSTCASFMANEAYKHQNKAANHTEWAGDQSNLSNGDAS